MNQSVFCSACRCRIRTEKLGSGWTFSPYYYALMKVEVQPYQQLSVDNFTRSQMKVKVSEVFKNGEHFFAKAWFNKEEGGVLAIKENVYKVLKLIGINKPGKELAMNPDDLIDKQVTKSFYEKVTRTKVS